ncbi:hypothetical protein [Cellulomonas taurus]|uniref:hypothetical protein n=1 Tax=Cellulomonas taurus TaxID=2729175 RepID=UPI00145EF366|nr:hypothetical protein [Cellulomonas taurus]
MSVWWQALLVLGLLVVSGGLGWWVSALVLRLADRGDPARVRRAKERLRGGTWIGILERLAVTGCLLADQAAGIAVVVAIKGLGRYPELRDGKDAGVSERFVIGTLASFLWAGAVGVLGRWLLTR